MNALEKIMLYEMRWEAVMKGRQVAGKHGTEAP
mgnify:FL=1